MAESDPQAGAVVQDEGLQGEQQVSMDMQPQARETQLQQQPQLQVPDTGGQGGAVEGFPVRTKLYSQLIGGVATDFSFSMYADRVLIIVTQLGSSGTILTSSNDSMYGAPSATFSTSVVMGKRDEPMLPLCARQISESAAQAGCFKPMIICLGLKEHSLAVAREIVQAVAANNVWNS